MTSGPQLFSVDAKTKESQPVEEVDFSHLGLKERWDIQEWIAANPAILGDDLLIVGKEFSDFDQISERLDLLAVDTSGKLVIIELKRDDSGSNVHWQAIKYASYLNRASTDDVVGMLAAYEKISETEAQDKLLEHLDSVGLEALNNDQRIILASHRFAPQVTSAALWLNEKASGDDLITCVQLTPHRDSETKSLYIQANTIIPVPGIDDYIIGIGDSRDSGTGITRNDSRRRSTANSRDDITRFLRQVGDLATANLPNGLKPDKKSKFSGGWTGAAINYRYYRLWYTDAPWANWQLCYCVHLNRKPDDEIEGWPAEIRFQYRKTGKWVALLPTEAEELNSRLSKLQISNSNEITTGGFGGIFVSHQGESLDDSFANTLADSLKRLIEEVTPVVNQFEEDRNTMDA